MPTYTLRSTRRTNNWVPVPKVWLRISAGASMSCRFTATPTNRPCCRDASLRGPTKPLGCPISLGSRSGDRFPFRSEFRPLRQPGIPSKRNREAGTFTIAGDAGRRYVMLSALTETAPGSLVKASTGLQMPSHFSDGSPKNISASPHYFQLFALHRNITLCLDAMRAESRGVIQLCNGGEPILLDQR